MKTTWLLIAFLTMFLSFSMSCYAWDETGNVMIFGFGHSSCGKMTEDIEKYSDGKKVYQAYIDGWLSGYNMGRAGKADFVDGADSISCYKFVLKYCEDNPLDIVSVGINKLILKFNKDIR